MNENVFVLDKQARFGWVGDLPSEKQVLLMYAVEKAVKETGISPEEVAKAVEDARNSKVVDLEDTVTLEYVGKNRDLSAVQPIMAEDYWSGEDRGLMQPLLDALAKGDFELAAELTPEGRRLCGYKIVREEYVEEQHGHTGYAADFEHTRVPAGVYPIFATEFQRNERENKYTNELAMNCGYYTWLEGECFASHFEWREPYPHVICSSWYTYDMAAKVLESPEGNVQLITPFEAREKEFTFYNGVVPHKTHVIVDASLPELVEFNPMKPSREKALNIAKAWLEKNGIDLNNQDSPSITGRMRHSFWKMGDGRYRFGGKGISENFSREELCPTQSLEEKIAGAKKIQERQGGKPAKEHHRDNFEK